MIDYENQRKILREQLIEAKTNLILRRKYYENVEHQEEYNQALKEVEKITKETARLVAEERGGRK